MDRNIVIALVSVGVAGAAFGAAVTLLITYVTMMRKV